ncbi:MAG: type II secretion system protein N [Proteobacteria bacterium]|nr:type II secretion system protein N [Pseudomonadota bacterium]
MISSKRGLITLGVLALTLGLLVLFPARVAYDWFAPPEISISGIHGSVWAGSVGEISVSGLYVRNLSWRIQPLKLLTGKLSYRIVGTPPAGILESDISVGFGGSITLRSLTAALPLAMFAESFNIRGLEGDASLQFSHLELRDGLLLVAHGTLQVANLIVPLIGRDSLGGYKAEFFSQDNGITASIEDTDGVVDLAGSLQINSDRTFAFIGQVVAKPGAPAGVLQQMRYLPPADDRGQHELRLEGAF